MGAFQPVMGLYPILPHPCYVPARPVVRSVKVVWPGGRKPVPNHPPPPESLCLQTLYLAPPPPRPVGRDAPFPSPGKTHPSGLGATSLAQIICSGAGRGHREGASAHLGEGGWEDTQQVATSCPHALGSQPRKTICLWSRACSPLGDLCPKPGPGSAAAGGGLGHSQVWGDCIQ